jgi:leucyl-tRNA synthetase
MKNYDHIKIEKKWQKEWGNKGTYKTLNPGTSSTLALASRSKKMYVLDMFPYPSGAGLHVGHPRGYIGSDVYARMKRMWGYNVLHPMGYDAFGLPAEQYALAHKIHPQKAVEENVKTFKHQLSMIGLSYDWSREVNTTDPKYYKWTQWIFLRIYNSWFDKIKNKARPIKELEKIFEKSGNSKINAVCDSNTNIFSAKEWKKYSKKEKQDILMKYRLAYEGHSEVNWCEEMGTVLANDEIVNDTNGNPVSERGGYKVEKKSMRQWFMRITAYADRLLLGLDGLEWSDHIKEIQRNWIGKSEGSEISFKVKNPSPTGEDLGEVELESIKVFTTRADTIFGATYVVLAPEHELVQKLKNQITNWDEVKEYIEKVKNKTDEDRTKNDKVKTGVELKGVMAINPATGEEIPIWVADYVLAGYGTGAIMAVPQHDERDRDFATKFNLPIVDAPLVDIKDITEKLGGKIVTKYKMRDAIFARQRYWGEPIPLKHNSDGTITELKEKDLPLELPNVKSYVSTGTGESPLAGVKSWIKEGYETNTMPGWAGSSWYFLRYMDPQNTKNFASKKTIDYWNSVDMYVGGAEHATGHLLYSRFWNNFLYDMGYVSFREPFKKMKNLGMILATDGRKMSKRWGNVINPDDIVKNYGADTLRIYEMFMGPFEQSLPWSTESIIGSRRFLEKVWRIGERINCNPSPALPKRKGEELKVLPSGEDLGEVSLFQKLLHKTIKKVSEDIEDFAFNTAISTMMIFVNEIEKFEKIRVEDFKKFLQILSPFAPHITEELWQQLSESIPSLTLSKWEKKRVLKFQSIHLSSWPKWDKMKIIEEEIKIVVQVNGKVRAEIMIKKDMQEEEIKALAIGNTSVNNWIENKEIKRVIYIAGRVINIVI